MKFRIHDLDRLCFLLKKKGQCNRQLLIVRLIILDVVGERKITDCGRLIYICIKHVQVFVVLKLH